MGNWKKTYITPLGNKTTSKPLTDIESFRYRQAADMSIGGQLRKANLRLQELKAKQAERASEVHKDIGSSHLHTAPAIRQGKQRIESSH